ncbi:hypothetical protein ACIQ6V_33765, partial [Streptomyces sp. NPDC096198]|uniref:hypothetical protein n=1 Tax=Streptomyces sp. NPDC096198 TaxID=3366080 RepID=UPI0037FF9417
EVHEMASMILRSPSFIDLKSAKGVWDFAEINSGCSSILENLRTLYHEVTLDFDEKGALEEEHEFLSAFCSVVESMEEVNSVAVAVDSGLRMAFMEPCRAAHEEIEVILHFLCRRMQELST